MRKILFLLFLAVSYHSFGQTRPAYCEVTASSSSLLGSGKDIVIIDLGDERKGTIVDEDGKTMKFNSHVDILNHMSHLGWKVIQVYPYSDMTSGKQNVLRFLLEKQITDDTQIQEGIHIKVREKYKPGKSGDDMY